MTDLKNAAENFQSLLADKNPSDFGQNICQIVWVLLD